MDGKAPQIGIAGWKDYFYCTSCDQYFEDEDCTVAIDDLEAWKLGRGYLPPLIEETGDNSHPFAWISVMFAALLGLAITLFIKKRSKAS